LALAFAAGIAAAGSAGGVLALAGCAAAALLLACRQRLRPLALLAGAAAVGAGACIAALAARTALPASETVSIEGVVLRPPERYERARTHVLLRSDSGACVQVTVAQGGVALLPGDRVRARLRLHLPQGFANPGSYDAGRLARARGIDYVAGVPDAAHLVPLASPPGAGPWRWAGALRARLARRLQATLPAGTSRGLLLALLLGERGEVPTQLEDDFRAAGVTHVLSVSGLHLAAAALLLYGGLRRLLLRIQPLALRVEARRLAAACAIPALWAYALVTGAAVATCRAAWMATLVLAAVASGRRAPAAGALGAAAIALLLDSPLLLYEPSFQLSFAAMIGLCAGAPRLAGPAAGRIRRFWAATLAAALATLPIAAYHFQQLAPATLIGNALVVPLCELLVLPLGLGGLALGLLAPLAALGRWALRGAALGAAAMAGAAHLLATLLPAWMVGAPTPGQIALYYGALVLYLVGRSAPGRIRPSSWAPRHDRLARRAALGLLLALVAWIAAARVHTWRSRDLVVTFLDVGQGDATLLELPHGHAVLVDGGGSFDPSFDPGASVLEPLLRRRHIGRLDLVVLSHPHPDHMNGLVRVLERFQVDEFWESGERVEAASYRRLQELVAAHKVRRDPPGTREIAGVHIDVLGPRGGADVARSTNDNSLVLRIAYAGRVLLLPGDIERDSEDELLAAAAPLRADILKVPHHGSRTSSTPAFVAAVAPALAVFPAGADNRFGFPHPEVLARYRCPVRITGRDGAVTVTIRASGQLGLATVRAAR
jgi:competence protein ComEC